MELLANPLMGLGLLGASTGLFLGLPLVAGRSRAIPQRWLGGLLTVASIVSLLIASKHALASDLRLVLAAAERSLGLASGPLLLGFVCAASGRREALRAWLVHLLPALLCALLVPARVVPPVELVMIHQLGYTMVAWRIFWRLGSDANGRTTGYEPWVRHLLIWSSFLHLCQWLRLFFRHDPASRLLVPAALLLGLLTLAGMAVRGSLVLVASTSSTVPDRYKRSRLPPSHVAALLADLEELVEKQGLFRRPHLDLRAVAETLAVSPHNLSQLLNQHQAESFGDYIARLRVEDAKARLADPANSGITIEAIGLDSGFGSRSAFYAAFSRLTGMTPLEYRRRSRSRHR